MKIKSARLIPLFDTHSAFVKTSEAEYEESRPYITEYIAGFQGQLNARADYDAVRQFLKSNSKVETTFNNYRTQVERLLLWAWNMRGKSILAFRRVDMEEFMDFCCKPDASWVSTSISSRFVLDGGVFAPNPEWRPFSMRVGKAAKKLASERNASAPKPTFQIAASSIRQVYAVLNSLFNFCAHEQLMGINPCLHIGKNKDKWTSRDMVEVSSKSLTHLQWDFVLETAELMAKESPTKGVRTLFCIAMMRGCYARISDLVGNGKWRPTMGSFKQTENGWWYHVVGKGNVQDKIGVMPDCIEHLKRYRQMLGLSDYPYPGESEPLLRTAHGRAGLTGRQVRKDVQEVFDRTIARMQADGFTESETGALRSATMHWFRHTGATFDAPFRNPKNLQADMRHKSLATTQNIYYNTIDDERAAETSRLKLQR